MTTLFPEGLDVFDPKVDGTDSVMAAHINDLQDSVMALESALGTGTVLDGSGFRGNLLPNSDFRLGSAGWTNTGFGSFHVATGTEPVRLIVDTVFGMDDAEVVSKPIVLKDAPANSIFILSGDIACPSVTAGALKIRLSAYDALDAEVGFAEIAGVNGQSAKRYAAALTIPDGACSLRVRCIATGGTVFDTGAAIGFGRIKVERDSGVGKPSPYSAEADAELTNSAGAGAFYFPVAGAQDWRGPYDALLFARTQADSDYGVWQPVSTVLPGYPTGAAGARINLYISASHGTGANANHYADIYIRPSGATAEPGSPSARAYAYLANEISVSTNTVDVPLDSNGNFELKWARGLATGGSFNIKAFLAGWYAPHYPDNLSAIPSDL